MGEDFHKEIRVIFRGIAPWQDAFLDRFCEEIKNNDYLVANIDSEKLLPVAKRFFEIMTDLIESSHCDDKFKGSLAVNLIGKEESCLCSRHLDEVYDTFIKTLRPFAGDLWKDDSQLHWNEFKETISNVCIEFGETV